jgi:hypothetical protein
MPICTTLSNPKKGAAGTLLPGKPLKNKIIKSQIKAGDK